MATKISTNGNSAASETLLERTTLCLPDFQTDTISQHGSPNFKTSLSQYYSSAESNACERLVQLKSRLRKASTNDFWDILMEESVDIVGAQCGMVSKQMFVDDVEGKEGQQMPSLCEPGSWLMGTAFYLNGGSAVKNMYHDFKYQAYGSPCQHMKHDKVFVVPERMPDFIRNNPNKLPWERSEAFIGVPLFDDGKAFAHFGMVWSAEGAAKRQLSWAFIEMFMHSLEDIIAQGLLEDPEKSKTGDNIKSDPSNGNVHIGD